MKEKYKPLPGVSGNYFNTPPPFPDSSLMIEYGEVRVDMTADYLKLWVRQSDGSWWMAVQKDFVPPLVRRQKRIRARAAK